MNDSNGLVSGVWLLKGLGSEPAVMAAVDGNLWITTDSGVVLDARIGSLEVSFPKIQFDGGCVIEHAGTKVRVSFVRPNGAANLSASALARMDTVLGAVGLIGAGSKFNDVRVGRKLGKAWKAVFESAGPSSATG